MGELQLCCKSTKLFEISYELVHIDLFICLLRLNNAELLSIAMD